MIIGRVWGTMHGGGESQAVSGDSRCGERCGIEEGANGRRDATKPLFWGTKWDLRGEEGGAKLCVNAGVDEGASADLSV